MTLTRFFPVVCAAISTLFLSLSLTLSAAEATNQLTLTTNWHDLFNGRDLTGWDKHLSRSDGKDIVPNEDPKNVFSITNLADGAAIHVSGEVYGAITTQAEFENFHFRIEFKWGEKRWPARQNVARDTGILYCCVGKPNPGTGWMTSVENNIMEKGVGQWWSVNGAIIDVEGELIKPEMELYIPYKKEGSGEQNLVWRRGLPLITAQPHNGITPPFDTEYVFGDWNTVEVIFWAGNCIHVLNGVPNLVAVNPRHKVNDRWHPLESGKIQLQSEAAEVFYRKPQIRLVTEIPHEYLELIPSPVKTTDGDEGFKKLFEGEDVITWKQAGPGKFTLENGIATSSGGMGLWWFSDRQYGDFILRGEFLQEQEAADSGVFLRFPDPGNDPWVAVKRGHEIEIGDPKAGNPTWHTGSIYPFQAPVQNASKPPGEWNAYEIVARGHNYSVRLNGKLVTTWTDPERRSTNGFIGLQSYDDGKNVRHRNLRIKPLRPTASP
ncbi:MAG TPA: DUF1080 domain-containing protein [Verrucomicrobiae bacterium]